MTAWLCLEVGSFRRQTENTVKGRARDASFQHGRRAIFRQRLYLTPEECLCSALKGAVACRP